ncbi:Stk1 family PASTA domain-containing Ser/Thr kinase [Corynebacterium epidermidicanis]|uniref:non-specific serine/threonine protein kinase n=1 Tax=Corynebacterium epidermidicanis TaxID=1050174 RepID=A0A0G3GLA0_9CORY|nr:Stk1 family PASTA domain-containing Ser/Thr kinase [Corynebacterium epidermidicanis]AKK01934.1 serine/threonine protein kinase [Corynebacterium epidermidicanis]
MPLHSLGQRYELGELIGTGGMSDVYRAKDTLLGRDVAVKIMRADLARDTGFRERFRKEAQNGGSLNHPAIVAVYDTGDTEDHGITVPYIVMELVEGKTLREIIRTDAPLPPADAAKLLIPVCEALQVSHDAGIIHRDIKPANIMVTPTGAIKVMDFGIARALGDATSTITATAAVVGTAQYLSPEQARGRTADARSDIYATGCVLYELLTGKPAFSGDSPLAIAYQHVEADPEPPSALIGSLSPTTGVNIDAVVLTAMAKHPEDRYQTATEFAEDLRRLQRNSVALAARNHVAAAPAAPVAAAPVAAAPAAAPTMVTGMTRAERREAERRQSSKPWGRVVASVLVLGLLAGGAYVAWTQLGDGLGSQRQESANVAIPSVKGKSEEEATAQLTKLGLQLERREAPSPTVPKGFVIDTNPTAGSQVRPGAAVTLTVSSGKEIVEVPSLAGLTTEQVSKALGDVGLQLESVVKEDFSADVPAGQVLEQSPAAGAQVSKGSKVTITVSKGEQLVRVPVIDGMKWSVAESNVTSLGFVPTVRVVDSTEPEGTVISVAESGQKLAKGSTVNVTVSNGAMVAAPSLDGMTVPQALAALRSAGWTAPDTSLQVKRIPTQALVDQGKIKGQSPAAGENLRKDGLVAVNVLEFQLLPSP